ncbi:MAG: hypothetical protein GX197_00415 [Firmicutes bacterium]|nr:hypothetical protein [Bacillota bacterium]
MPRLKRGCSAVGKNGLKPLIFMLAASLMVIGASLAVTVEPADRQQEQVEEEDAAYIKEMSLETIKRHDNLERVSKRENSVLNGEAQKTLAPRTMTETGSEKRQIRLAQALQAEKLQENEEETTDRNGNYLLSRGGQRVNYLDVYTVTATAYCPGTVASGCPHDENGRSVCTGKFNDGITASGMKAVAGDGSKEKPHLVAVDPDIFPLGSKLYIEGYGFAVAADTGQAIKGLRLDMLFPDHLSALKFGRRRLQVYRLPQ